MAYKFSVRALWTALVIGLVACTAASSGEEQNSTPLAIEHVSVIPMDGERVLESVTVVVEDGRVRAIGTVDETEVPTGATRIDGRGQFLIPGLWDMHAHPEGSPEGLGVFLATGVTGARVMWGTPEHVEYRDRIADGQLIGPELYVSGTIVEGEPPAELADVIDTEGRDLVRDSTDGAEVVRRHAAEGYDFIKVYNNIPLDAYRGIVIEAEKLGLPVAGHVPFAVGLEGVIEARQASIEHLRGYVWHIVPEDAPQPPGADLRSRTLSWEYGDLSRIDELATMTRDAGVWNVPTLAVRLVWMPDSYIDEYLASEEGSHLSDDMRAFYTERRSIPWLSNFSDADFAAAVNGFAVQDSLVRALVGVGAGVMAGTDTPPWGFSLHTELERLVEVGLTPYQALETATRNPARFLGRKDGSGTVAVGSPADLVLLAENPLEDIRNTRKIVGLVRRGEWYDRAVLDKLLAEAEGSMTSQRHSAVWLDHFVVAIDDLDAGVAAFEGLTGVRPMRGGDHPSLGTHNALVSLGGEQYLEILAPRPGATLHEMVREVGEHETLTPILWALATDDIVELHRLVRASGYHADEPAPGSRVTEDGDTLRWSMFMMGEGSPANAPFFIQWDPSARHPSASAPDGCSLESLTVASVDNEALESLLAAVGFTVPVIAGPNRTVISLKTPRGVVTIGD